MELRNLHLIYYRHTIDLLNENTIEVINGHTIDVLNGHTKDVINGHIIDILMGVFRLPREWIQHISLAQIQIQLSFEIFGLF